jgi:hypothetical protein
VCLGQLFIGIFLTTATTPFFLEAIKKNLTFFPTIATINFTGDNSNRGDIDRGKGKRN